MPIDIADDKKTIIYRCDECKKDMLLDMLGSVRSTTPALDDQIRTMLKDPKGEKEIRDHLERQVRNRYHETSGKCRECSKPKSSKVLNKIWKIVRNTFGGGVSEAKA
jgi:ribosomal protein L37AE/L43A